MSFLSLFTNTLFDVKVYLHLNSSESPDSASETRRFNLSSYTYDDLIKKIRSSFSSFIKRNQKFKTFYLDDENELIRFTTGNEMKNAISVIRANQSILQIIQAPLFKVHVYLEQITVTDSNNSDNSPFTNLLKNPCGQNGLKHWYILENNINRINKENLKIIIPLCQTDQLSGSQVSLAWQWKIEIDQPGVNIPLTDENNNKCRNFANSHQPTEKVQVIDLYKEEQILDLIENSSKNNVDLELEIIEHFSGRNDCGSIYRLSVYLINENLETIDEFLFKSNTRSEWQSVNHTFRLNDRFRYVIFIHGGNSLSLLNGHYGSKITNASVKFKYSAPEYHEGVLCDGCGFEMIGWRYKCKTCKDYNLCQNCKAENVHNQHDLPGQNGLINRYTV